MKSVLKVMGIVVMVCLAVMVMADDEFNAPIQESYVGQNYNYTNSTGSRVKLSVAAFSGSFESGTNSTITLTDGNNVILISEKAVSSTIMWADGETSFMLDRDAVITAFTPSAATQTNWAYILTKQ